MSLKKRRAFKTLAATLAAAALSFAGISAANADTNNTPFPWENTALSTSERVELLLGAMSEDHLINMLHGDSNLIGGRTTPGGPPSTGYIRPIPELRVPALVLTDGPAGLRNGEAATALPAPIAQAATFNRQLAYDYGKLIGEETKQRGIDLLFAPGFNLARVPEAGRTFEYLGEDPYLAGTLAAANTNGIQDAGIMATLKHYVANNQETNRTLSSSNVDPRTLREIYEKPFKIAIAGSDPAAVMCSYNKINNETGCGSKSTLTNDLRGLLDFKGFVVTDYPAMWDVKDLDAGLNVELPGQDYTKKSNIEKAIAAGDLTWDTIKQRVRETLTQMFRFGVFDHPWDAAAKDRVRVISAIDPAPGNAVAQKTLEEGAVLLKNDGMLPLDPNGASRVLVVGRGADGAISGGGSSGVVNKLGDDKAFDQIKARLGAGTKLIYKSEFDPAGIAIEAKKADYVLVFPTMWNTELFDRMNLDWMPHNNNAIEIAAKYNDKVAVITQAGGPTLMPWLDKVEGVLNIWYPGQAGGEATARILYGEVNPSGRLPQTFPASNSQKPASQSRQFPGANAGFQSYYDEGVFMGYRWYATMDQTPLFPFGYGLSYTDFEYSDFQLAQSSGTPGSPVTAHVKITNTGNYAGKVAPQLYVSKPATLGAVPARELASFDKVELAPGESKVVALQVDPLQLSVFDTGSNDFVVPRGNYTFHIADNVNDLKASIGYTVR
ncbi:MAG: glycoside hydrolase family 3 C-terminal domain-containing protein [Actinomycetaceae bacterium]|nr:glycoside hydrolase family 3 C-terminal domain-containing protein [Actinomycetaceae bacterium]